MMQTKPIHLDPNKVRDIDFLATRLKNKKVDLNYDAMLRFILEIKDILNKLTYEKTNNIRKKIQEL